MTLTEQLGLFLTSGVRHVGEIQISTNDSNDQFKLFHHSDAERVSQPDFGGLEVFHGPSEARQISLYGEDGAYRFLKAQRNLRQGWVMVIGSLADPLQEIVLSSIVLSPISSTFPLVRAMHSPRRSTMNQRAIAVRVGLRDAQSA